MLDMVEKNCLSSEATKGEASRSWMSGDWAKEGHCERPMGAKQSGSGRSFGSAQGRKLRCPARTPPPLGLERGCNSPWHLLQSVSASGSGDFALEIQHPAGQCTASKPQILEGFGNSNPGRFRIAGLAFSPTLALSRPELGLGE